MTLGTGRFARRLALVAGVAALAAFGAGPARAVRVPGQSAERLRWFVGNSLVATRLAYGPDGRVVATGLRDVTGSLDWGSPAGGLGFRIVLRAPSPDAAPDADPATFEPVTITEGSMWDLVGGTVHTASDGTMSLDLALASREAPVSVTWILVCHPESPVVRSSVAVTNTGARRILLEAVDGIDAGLTADAGTLDSLAVNNFNWGHPTTGFQTTQTTLAPGVSALARTGPDGAQAAWLALR